MVKWESTYFCIINYVAKVSAAFAIVTGILTNGNTVNFKLHFHWFLG